jgi:hypothetical protein
MDEVATSIEFRGLEELKKYIPRMLNSMRRKIKKANNDCAETIQSTAKMKAPSDTGNLRNSIQLEIKGNQARVFTDAPYALPQELGFAPHAIPGLYFQQHYASPGMKGVPTYPLPDGLDYFMVVKKHTAFMAPATEVGLMYLQPMLEQAAEEAIRG